MTETRVETALRYAGYGWKVIPVHKLKVIDQETGRRVCDCDQGAVCASPGKHPYQNNWTTRYYDNGPDVVDIWENVYPDANIGIVTGAVSGIWALDVDSYKGGDETMATILAQVGEIWLAGRVHQTGNGGTHHFYQLPEGEPLKSRSDVFWKDCGVDVRAKDGFVVAPNSESGYGVYTELHTNPVPPAPAWLLARVRERETMAEAGPLPIHEPPPLPSELPDELAALMGDLDAVPRYRHLWRIAAAARRADLSVGQAYALCLEWVLANQDAHPEVPGKWEGPRQAQCVAADVARNWAKLDGERNRLELPFQVFTGALDPHEMAAARQGLDDATLEIGEGHPLLARLARRLPDLETAARLVAKHQLVDWCQLEEPLPPAEWLVPQVIERGRFVLLYAREGAGKSLVLQQQMGACVAGRILGAAETLGHPPTVLYLDRENNWPDLHERYNAAGFKPDDLARLRYVLVDEMPMLNTPAGAQELLALAYRYQADAVIIDTFSRFVDGEANAPDAPNAFFRLAAKPLTDAGVAVVVLDHMAKDEKVTGPIGSKAKTTSPHVVWRMWRKNETQLRLINEKDRQRHVPPYLAVTQGANPLDFEFEPMTKQEYRKENSVLGDDDTPDEERTVRPVGRPRKSDTAKLLPLVARIDAVFGVDAHPTWTEVRRVVKGNGNLITPAREYRRLRQQKSPQVGFGGGEDE